MKKNKLPDSLSIFSSTILIVGYIGISYFILSLTMSKTFFFYLSIILFAITYGLICNWIFTGKYILYDIFKFICILIMIVFIVLNHKLLSLIN